jgi:hypothetical protein
MPSFGQGSGRIRSPARPPIEFTHSANDITIPTGTTGFNYVLCGGGGGGGSAGTGDRKGGGGGCAGTAVKGSVLNVELAEVLGVPIASILLVPTLGSGGAGGAVQALVDRDGISGLLGQDSTLIAKINLPSNPTIATISIAPGGSPGMGGSQLIGWSRDDRACSFDQNGGRGIPSIKNEAWIGDDRLTPINVYGNGGHGGGIGQAGMPGQNGYFSIAFF